jgi:hypothetical protein
VIYSQGTEPVVVMWVAEVMVGSETAVLTLSSIDKQSFIISFVVKIQTNNTRASRDFPPE